MTISFSRLQKFADNLQKKSKEAVFIAVVYWSWDHDSSTELRYEFYQPSLSRTLQFNNVDELIEEIEKRLNPKPKDKGIHLKKSCSKF